MKKKIKKSKANKYKAKKGVWYKSLPFKFSAISVSILGCLIIAAIGLYNIVPKNGVLGASTAKSATTQYRNCYVIRVQNGRLSAQLGESKHGNTSEGIYRYGSRMQKAECTISPSDKFEHNVPAPKPVYIKFVTSSGADLPANFFKGKPGISVFMNVWQMPDKTSNGITGSYGTTVPASGKVIMYQYGSTKTTANGNEWSLHCGDGTSTPCFAENKLFLTAQYNSKYYTIKPEPNLADKTGHLVTYVSPLLDQPGYGDINHFICGNRAGNECKFFITVKAQPKPTPTPRVCRTSSKQTCYYGKWCTQVSNSCSARVSYKNCYVKSGYCGVPQTCSQAKGYCATAQYCHGSGGQSITATGCSSGQICCK